MTIRPRIPTRLLTGETWLLPGSFGVARAPAGRRRGVRGCFSRLGAATRGVACLALMALGVAVLPAQEFRATLQGTVTDQSEAAVPNAVIVLKNVETSIERTESSGPAGHYLFSFVSPGKYSLTVKATGFKTELRDGLVLSVSQNAQLDVALSLGVAAETVSVTASVAGVETQSSSLGGVVRQDVINNLPLKGHSSLNMYNLEPGVVSDRYQDDIRPNDATYSTGIRVDGGPKAALEVAVDGVPNLVNLNRGQSIAAWIPSVDAVSEMKLQTGTLAAEYGFNGAAVTTMVTKSGTNDLHGSAFEFYRNQALNANLFFANSNGTPLAPFSYHTFSGSLGGPIYVPKIFNGKNRAFFFFNYEGARQWDPYQTVSTVPTPKMLTGDFSQSPAVLYDPFSVHTSNGTPVRDPFPGNIIPASLQDPIGQKMLSYYPAPNATGSDPAHPWVNDLSNTINRYRWWNYYTAKVDFQFSPRNQAFIRVNTGNSQLDFGHNWDGLATPSANYVYRPQSGAAISDTYIVNPSTAMSVRLGFAYGQEKEIPWSAGFDPKQLGLSASYAGLEQFAMFPAVSLSGFTGLSGQTYMRNPGYTYSLQGNISHVTGRHLLKFGAEGRLLRGNYLTNSYPSGQFSFNSSWTGGPRADTPVSTSGFAVASLLLGIGSGGGIESDPALSVQNILYCFFAQDDYRVTSKLTVNYGMRYEYEGPMTERYNRTTRGWAYNTANPLKVPGLNLTGGLLYAGVNGADRGLYAPDRNNFAPRIGLAYSFARKTVFRAGYGMFYIPYNGGNVQSTGYSNTTPWTTTTDGITPINRLSKDPFPNGLLPAIGNSKGLSTLLGQNISFVEPADRSPILHDWHAGIQRELPGGTLFEIAYVGTKGTRLLNAAEQLNQLNPSYLSMGAALLQNVPNPFYGIITTGSLSGATVQAQQLLLPYPEFGSVTRIQPAYGNSSYHSAQVRIDKRLAYGLSGMLAFTLSKNISDLNSAQNAYDRQSERAVSGIDASQRLNFVLLWEVPVGRNRHFLSSASRPVDALVGGWQFSSSGYFQAGYPVAISLATRNIYGANTGQRPNAVGDPEAGISGSIGSRLTHYFNTAAFAQPANFTFGNLGARVPTVCIPGIVTNNLALAKEFPVHERLKAEFRASAYNFLNHPIFDVPGTTLGNANFGIISNQANTSREIEFQIRLRF